MEFDGKIEQIMEKQKERIEKEKKKEKNEINLKYYKIDYKFLKFEGIEFLIPKMRIEHFFELVN